ncbi:hypothetical protein J6590_081473 [Homalodisca vitripennis]|nr:hypothetical protein J6590_081473 [Homalodisca vitripennis]
MTHLTQSTIYNIISNLSSVAVSVVSTAISDHYDQEAIINGVKIERELKIIKIIRNLRPGNIALLNTSLSKENWKHQDSTHATAKAYDVSKSIISSKNIYKTAWDIINNKNKSCNKQIKLKSGDRLVEDAVEVANRFNRLFGSVACEQGPCPSPHKESQDEGSVQ